ncbi:mucin-associated surface protein (MASP), putative [Trypanosoma cruzi marinkellei]|uniref:Mucin-associated surface protein (MASP), putative n=1 Tax=Trypanosoma cruzi marinkellei TaxID=85056 RepID=K2MAV2_TRYCR|nr:mucin-associated surface protein (MASP), putative [Trypanosoma cruzi marinkellei]
MMMTGRVLWVCALCVLWCGVCSGGGKSSPSAVNTVTENETQNVNGTTVDKGSNQGDKFSALQAESSATVVRDAAAPLPQAPPPLEGEAKATGNSETVKLDTKNGKQQEDGEEEEEEEEEEDEDGEDEEEEEEEEEEEDEEEDEEGEGDDVKENVTGSQKGMSAGGQEQPSLSSGAEGASNKTNLNSTQTTDGSTTASHSTSPVLLLVVACAAASAVLAA